HRHLAHLDRSAEVTKRLLHQFADGERGHAYRIGGEHEEAAVSVEQPAAVGEQGREIVFEPPDLAGGPAAELGRVEQYAVVAPGTPNLARGELARVVDDPADRLVAHAGEPHVIPALLDRLLRCIDMNQPSSSVAQQL